jgi:integrase
LKPQNHAPTPRYQRTASGLYVKEISHPLIVGRRLRISAGSLHELVEDQETIANWQRDYRRSRLSLEEFRTRLARYDNPRAVAVRLRDAWVDHEARARSSMRAKLRAIWRKQLAPELGELAAIELTPRRLGEWEKWCIGEGYAPKTTRDAWTQLVACVRAVLVDGDDFPWKTGPGKYWRPTRAPRPVTQRPACTSVGEAERLIAAALDDDRRVRIDRGAFADLAQRCAVGLFCALRNGEIAGLAWDDLALDADRPRVRIQHQAIDQWRTHSAESSAAGRPLDPPKGGRVRELPLHPTAIAALLAQRDLLRARRWYRPTGPVFPAPEGSPWEGTWRNNANGIAPEDFRRIAIAAGLPFASEWVPHSLRHSSATLESVAGADLRSIQKRTGHASLRVLEDYINARVGRGDSAIAALPVRFDEGSEESS